MEKKGIRRLCTGMTRDELKKNIKAFEKGKKSVRRCYLCKRPEGSQSILLTLDKDEPLSWPVKLNLIKRKVSDDFAFEYYICLECAVLVGMKSNTIFPAKIKKYRLPIGFPAGPAPDYYS